MNLLLVAEKVEQFNHDEIEVHFYSANLDNIIMRKLSEFSGDSFNEQIVNITFAGELAFFLFPDGEKIFV